MTSSTPQTIVHLGLQAELALQELGAVAGVEPLKITHSFVSIPSMVATPEVMSRLAGVVRYGEYIAGGVTFDDLVTTIADVLQEMRRPEFVLNMAGNSMTPKLREGLALSIKRELRSREISSRWVSGPDLIASTVLVAKQGVLAKGAEITCIKSADGLYTIMRTSRIQDFEEWSEQDYGRPQRDAKRGMLPPKLARMMLNIAIGSRNPEQITVCDPFCGVGTVITEAMRLGVKAVFASDVDMQAVEGAQKNVDWLQKLHPLATVVTIRQGDARRLSSVFPDARVDVLVSETYLGAPQHGASDSQRISVVAKHVTEILKPGLAACAQVLPKNSTMVVTIPSWRLSDGTIYTLPSELFPENLLCSPEFPVEYSREDQIVIRQVYAMRKK